MKVDDEDEKDVLLWQTLEAHRNEKVLVYVDRRAGKRSTEDLSRVALQKEFEAAFFHGAMSTDEKIEVIRKFKAGELELVFATSAFGMGIDIPTASHLHSPGDIAGIYSAIGAGLSVAGGRQVAQLTNARGVVLRLHGRQIGFSFSIDLSGMSISLA